MNYQSYFTIAELFFTINMIFFFRPVILAFFGEKNLVEILSQIVKIIFGIIKGFFTVIFTRRIYYKPYSETSQKFENLYQNQILWIGGGNKLRGNIINILSYVIMIISYIYGF
tara:strand:- start:3971 stop:4309 length:339 start_codon:yes stop_codon:yes gene_type:complete